MKKNMKQKKRKQTSASYSFKNTKELFIIFLIFSLFSLFFCFIYYRLATSFSFVDEFNNIVAGYFMLQGSKLYTDVFFNHQMLMPYISYAIQKVTHPNSLYQLIIIHRIVIIITSILSGLLLCFRFRLAGLAFFILYESIKYYLFGFLFLAESMIVYPLVYLFGISLLKLDKNQKIFVFDYILAGIFTWFVIFSREPYIPLAIVLYSAILVGNLDRKIKMISISILVILSTISLGLVASKEYIVDLFEVNIDSLGTIEAYQSVF